MRFSDEARDKRERTFKPSKPSTTGNTRRRPDYSVNKEAEINEPKLTKPKSKPKKKNDDVWGFADDKESKPKANTTKINKF